MTPNGVSGIKLQFHQFVELQKSLRHIEGFGRLSTPALMARAFPNIRYLWLTRRDKARQAISYFLAQKTGRWWIVEGGVPERSGHASQPEFDPRVIAQLERMLIENDSQWRLFFTTNNIAVLTVFYEDLATNYRATILDVLKWLGIPDTGAVKVPPPRVKKQSNDINELWLDKYMSLKNQGILQGGV